MSAVALIAPAILPGRIVRRDERGLPVREAPEPCPELLTEEEASRYLRLDECGIKNPDESLERYRARGLLRGTQVSKRVFYRRLELERLLERLTADNPR